MLEDTIFSNCEGFHSSEMKELAKQHYPELEILLINHSLEVEKTDEILKELLENCPRLKHIYFISLEDLPNFKFTLYLT